MHVDPKGMLHTESRPDRFWSTTNLGEAMPGVASPLGWSLWMPTVDLSVRDCFARIGALPRKQVFLQPNPNDRVAAVFYGRAALNVNFFCDMGSRLPGTSPDAIARQLLGEVPSEIPLKSTQKRMPVVAVKMPYALATIRRDVLKGTAPVHGWWQRQLRAVEGADRAGAARALDEARTMFMEAVRVQAGGVFIGVQPIYDQLLALIDKAGLDHASSNALLAGQGSHSETEIIVDLWALGRGKLRQDEFLARHGYHGPHAGEVSAVVWREDPAPVHRLAEQYGGRDQDSDPAHAAKERTRAREAAERELLAKLPRLQQQAAKVVLKLAVLRMPLRGTAKAAYLQAIDAARASARRLGTVLAEEGELDDREDVFYLAVDELTAPRLPANARELVAERRAQREEFQRYDIKSHWRGDPTPFEIEGRAADEDAVVGGIGASGGVAEGTVRVVHDPTFTDIEPDEVLVCVTTDPSWASVLFLSSALVVDIGGLLSHAAVVAREIGVPCVIGTGNGTQVLRTGDRVRVDGNAGTVEILERAPAAPADAAESTT